MINADIVKAQAPSVFTQKRHPERTSENYVHINTMDVLEMFENEGWLVTSAMQARSRSATTGRLYTAHTLRLRHADSLLGNKMKVNDTFPEIVIRNSHDGGRSMSMLAGLFRLVCSNGMVVGQGLECRRIRHSGEGVLEAVKEGGVWVVKSAQNAQKASVAMSKIRLTKEQQVRFANDISLAITDDKKRFPADQLLAIRREEDEAPTLWNVFNRAQENIIKGGMQLVSDHGRPSRSRAIINADRDVKINQRLWDVAQKWAA